MEKVKENVFCFSLSTLQTIYLYSKYVLRIIVKVNNELQGDRC